jgi:hypothetical protein
MQFHFWEYVIGNQTLILDSHRPFICSVVLVQYLVNILCTLL